MRKWWNLVALLAVFYLGWVARGISDGCGPFASLGCHR